MAWNNRNQLPPSYRGLEFGIGVWRLWNESFPASSSFWERQAFLGLWWPPLSHDLLIQCPSAFLLQGTLLLDLDLSQFSSVAQSWPTFCDSMNRNMPGLPVHHQLPEFTQTHVHQVGDAIQPSHPLLSPSPAPNPSQHQSLFQWVNSSHQVAKVLEFQL